MANQNPKPKIRLTTTENMGKGPEPVMELQTPQTSNSDLVTVQVLKGCRPPPIVGIFSFSAEFSVSQIVERETYQVPRYVAQVLSENGYLVITVDPAAAATQAPARLPASVPPTDSE